ncbi:hypothetical protein [Paenarthrobacter sp. DKR-5]|uniref:hypothetical protein n=1 Tax=Paenarthrobacter sp. DKR-5 TaxID=2835535 RepID=UPI002029724B|nr:hypothetical protein [Paenarthrobacter sp. DKR-5]
MAKFLAAAAAALSLAMLTGCSGAAPQGQPAAPASSSSGAVSAPATDGATASASGTAAGTGSAAATAVPSATAAPTAAQWKTYADPAGTVSFDLPEEWTAQQVPVPSHPESLRVDVRDGSGKVLATLQTKIQGLGGACLPRDAKPYTVLASVPVNLPASGASGSIEPRFVFRAIQSYKYIASYGITNMVGGTDGKTCFAYNVVNGPAGVGIYMFGDELTLHPKKPAEAVAPQHAFDTLAQAAAYTRTAEFANLRRMITSLKIKP